LDLPILTGVPPAEAVRIRYAEAASFDRFRDALRVAMNERICSEEDPSSVDGIAAQIIGDVIGPSLNEIADSIEKSANLFGRSAGVSVAAGTVMTVAGLILQTPLLFPAGIAMWGIGSLPAVRKYFEDSRDVQLKDMYFLWSREIQARRRRR
jgi:hypothetical protein